MHVQRHRLYEDDDTPVPFLASPHQSDGFEPRYLVIHYTASLAIGSTVTWFLDRDARASAHVVVGRDGRTVQMVPFDCCAWHAGASEWDGVQNLNAHAFGIELVNAGALERTSAGDWIDWTGRRVPDGDVIVARHKHEAIDRGWHAFTPRQVERALAVAKALHGHYGFDAVLGHDDIAPGRKIDPGPAFPMARFASDVFASRAPTASIRATDA
jgi:N-acetylmuramoyl-L-alanine amidase